MAKSKFQRTKPHVNVGLGILFLIIVGAAAVYFLPTLKWYLPYQNNSSNAAQGTGLVFSEVNAEWNWIQGDCEAQSAALNLQFGLFNPNDAPVPLPGAKSLLLLVLFTPPDSEDDLSSVPPEPVAVGAAQLGPVQDANSPQDPPASNKMPNLSQGEESTYNVEVGVDGNWWGELLLMDEALPLNGDNSIFAWLPIYNSAGDPEPFFRLADANDPTEMQLLLLLVPEAPDIPGLFKDTADGEVQPSGNDAGDVVFTSLVVLPDANLGEDLIVGTYKFKLGGEEGILVLPRTSQAQGKESDALILWPQGPLFSPESGEQLLDLEILEPVPAYKGWANVDGLSVDTDVVEHRNGAPLCTPTPSSTPSPNPTSTSSPAPTSSPATASATATPTTGGAPPPSPTPTSSPPSSPTPTREEPPTATETPGRRLTPTSTPRTPVPN